MFYQRNKDRRLWPYILGFFIILIVSLSIGGYLWIRTLSVTDIFNSSFVQQQVKQKLGSTEAGLFEQVPFLLGFHEPQTYLLLFLNNTEMRPGGGFIGSYATIEVDKGQVRILALEGSEVLDKTTPANWRPIPPVPISEHLGVDRWYFRDSNWSPDFAVSSEKTLELYAGEHGVAAQDIDAVIGITPTVLEKLLAITGPINIQGITFTSENVTETLQYETEYGYADKDIAFIDRKQILKPFAEALMKRIHGSIFSEYKTYLDAVFTLADQKQILVYALDSGLQERVATEQWDGRLRYVPGDYLLWVDANLAALKTDHALDRSLSYRVEKIPSGEYVAHAVMQYKHTGAFDWRTSRYRTYARIFVPAGSILKEVHGHLRTDRSTEPGTVEQGEELGKQWFGTFTSVEPGETKTLEFVYILPPSVAGQIDNGSYHLLVQKQLGIVDSGLTLQLDFGKLLTGANPAEASEKWGDTVYEIQSDLRVDREFEVNF